MMNTRLLLAATLAIAASFTLAITTPVLAQNITAGNMTTEAGNMTTTADTAAGGSAAAGDEVEDEADEDEGGN